MVRVKRGNIARKRRNKVLKYTKGFFGSNSNAFRIANQQVLKSLRYAYIGRKNKKRIFRQLWIIRINAAAKKYSINYSKFIYKIKQSQILLNRKMLAQLAILDPKAFSILVSIIK